MCNNINSHVNTPLKTPDQSVTVCYLELNDIFSALKWKNFELSSS